MCQLVTKGTINSASENNQDSGEAIAGSSIGITWAYEVDYFSRWVEVEIIKSTTSEVIIKCLDKQFSRYKVPSTLRTDNGLNLASAEMEESWQASSIY